MLLLFLQKIYEKSAFIRLPSAPAILQDVCRSGTTYWLSLIANWRSGCVI
jgi:hypothetical protein